MKAITIHQPWAQLIGSGIKGYETRTWQTGYRGPIAIHAGRRRDHWRGWEPILREAGIELGQLEFGRVIAVATLADVQLTDTIRGQVSELELELGDWSEGRYAWKMQNVRRLGTAIPVRGFQGLWEFDDTLLRYAK